MFDSMRSLVLGLPEREQWAIVEKLALSMPQHRFVATNPRRAPSSWQVTFDCDAWLDYRPSRNQACALDETGNPILRSAKVDLNSIGKKLWHAADGGTPARQIIEGCDLDVCRSFFAMMWRLGMMFFPR